MRILSLSLIFLKFSADFLLFFIISWFFSYYFIISFFQVLISDKLSPQNGRISVPSFHASIRLLGAFCHGFMLHSQSFVSPYHQFLSFIEWLQISVGFEQESLQSHTWTMSRAHRKVWVLKETDKKLISKRNCELHKESLSWRINLKKAFQTKEHRVWRSSSRKTGSTSLWVTVKVRFMSFPLLSPEISCFSSQFDHKNWYCLL